jgi:hypothetical protein
MDEILGKMSGEAIEWLVCALEESMLREDNTYVDPVYQEVQDQVGVALWDIRCLIVKCASEYEKENV